MRRITRKQRFTRPLSVAPCFTNNLQRRKSTRAPRPLPKRKIFPFLQLPAEIRNVIYGYALSDPHCVYLVSTTQKYRRTVVRVNASSMQQYSYWNRYNRTVQYDSEEESQMGLRTLVPSLLAVNQQMYKEGRDILYANDFVAQDPLALHSFIVNIGPRAAGLIKTIALQSWGGRRGMHKAYNHSCFAVLVSATNIQEFKINGNLYSRGGAKWVARQVYRDAFPWLEAVGAAKGRADAAVDMITIAQENFDRHSWYRRNRPETDRGDDMQEFKTELSVLLGAHLKRIRATPGKKTKKDIDYEL